MTGRSLLIVIVSCSFAEAADVGTTSGQFLKLGVGPRAIAMGDAQVGLADDVYASHWNPAGLTQLEVQEAGFVQNQYIEQISQQYAAYALPRSTLGTFAGSMTYLNVGKFQGYDAAGQPTGQVDANDAAVGLSYAGTPFKNRRLGSAFSLGMTTKFIQERLDTVLAKAFAADLGLLLTPGRAWGGGLEGWNGGIIYRNLGTALKFDHEAFPLPRSLEAGVSYTGSWRNEIFTLAVDGRQPHEGRRSAGVGLELRTLQILIVRAGYTSAGDLGSGLRWGGGLRFKTIQVDYANAGAGGFGSAHRIGLTLRFGKMPEDPYAAAQRWYEKGLKDYRKKRFTEALIEFNKALEIDPSHPDALAMMKRTYEEIKTLVPE